MDGCAGKGTCKNEDQMLPKTHEKFKSRMVSELAIPVQGWRLVTDWSQGLLTGQPIVLVVLQANEKIYFKKQGE